MLASNSLFFFNDTATTEIYTLSLHDALPISLEGVRTHGRETALHSRPPARWCADRKSTRLNSSHQIISYAVFCLKKKIMSMVGIAGPIQTSAPPQLELPPAMQQKPRVPVRCS